MYSSVHNSNHNGVVRIIVCFFRGIIHECATGDIDSQIVECLYVCTLYIKGGAVLANSSVTGYPPSFLSALGKHPHRLYEAIQDKSAEPCFIFPRVHSVPYFFLENIVLEVLLHIC